MNAFLLSSYSFLVIIGFAGTPLTTVLGGTSLPRFPRLLRSFRGL